MLHPWLFVLLILLSPVYGYTATYYWNPAGAGGGWGAGADTNNGTSISTPWKTFKKVRDAGLTGANTVNIKVGNYVRSDYQAVANDYPVWTQAHSKGAAGAQLLIQSDPAGGGAQARFDGQRDGAWVSFSPTAVTDYYIIIKNIEFTNYVGGVINIGNGSLTAPHAAKAQHIAVISNYFHDLHQGGAAVTGTYIAQYAIFKDNIIIHNGIPDPWCCAGDHGYYVSHDSHNVVVDHNYAETLAGYHVHMNADFDNTSITDHVIVRRNTTVNANAGSIIVTGAKYQNIYLYNNTNYSEANTYPAIAGNTGVTSTKGAISFHGGAWELKDIKVVNNISAGYVDAGQGGLLYTDSTFESGLTGVFRLDYNWWNYVGGGGTQYKWNGTNYATKAAFTAASVYGDNDKEGVPGFTNPASGVRDFSLQPTSQAINAGTTLTTAVGAGTASTSLTVVDAGYFHDGYGLIVGDVIRVSSTTATVTSINYSTNVITLASALTWSNGAAVSLDYSGTAPDMGAIEFLEAPPPTGSSGPSGVDLDGVDDSIALASNSAYQYQNTTFTFAGWFKSTTDGYVFAKRNLSGAAGGYFFRLETDGRGRARLVDSANSAVNERATISTTLLNGNWHHVMVVYTTNTGVPASNDVTIYIDGVLDQGAGATPSTTYLGDLLPIIRFGNTSDKAVPTLTGSIANYGFWPVGLTAEHALRLYSSRALYPTLQLTYPTSYWPLDGCAEGVSGNGFVWPDRVRGGSDATGDAGTNTTGLTCHGVTTFTYPVDAE